MSKHPFNEDEWDVWNQIIDAMKAIQNLDERGPLPHNRESLSAAIHTLQQFVIQHMCNRLWPEEFSDWYGETG